MDTLELWWNLIQVETDKPFLHINSHDGRCKWRNSAQLNRIYLIIPVDIRMKHSPECIQITLLAIQMADKYGLTQEAYIFDATILSNRRYGEGMLFLILSFPAIAEAFQVILSTLMIYDFIYFIPQQVRVSICKHWFHIYLFPPRFSTFTGMFPTRSWDFGRLFPLTYRNLGESGRNRILSIFLSW